MLRELKGFCIVLFVLLCGPVFAQQPYSYSFNERHGFPINEIYYLYQDKRGSVWIGCNDGIFRYSNGSFRQFTNQQRNSRGISHILEDKYGRIWCQNFTRQIFCIEHDSMRLVFDASKYITVNPPIDVDSEGNLYVGAQGAFFVLYGDKKLKRVEMPVNTSPAEIFHDRDGSVLIAADKLYRWENGKLKTINKISDPDVMRTFGHGGMKFDYLGDRLLLYSELNTQRQYYLSELRGDSLLVNPIPAGLTQGRIFNISQVQDGRIWINTQNGTVCVDSNLHPVYGGKYFFGGSNVSDVMMDMEGNYWIATLESGIHIIPNIGIWQYTTANSELSANHVTALYASNTGLYAGYFNGIVDVLNAGHVEHKLFNNEKTQLVEKIDQCAGDLYISHGVVHAYDIKSGKTVKLGLVQGVKDFVFINDNEMLYATNVGAAMLKINDKIHDSAWYVCPSPTRCVAYDKLRHLRWVGCTDGAYYYDTAGTQKELLYKGAKIYAVCMRLGPDGILWIGTVNGNLLKVKDEEVIDVYSRQKGLHGNNVRVIYETGKQIWVATEKGLNIIDSTGNVTYIDSHDGLPAMEINDILVNDNMVYLASTKGLFVFSRYIKNINDVCPPIILERLRVNDREYALSKMLSLGSKENKLTFCLGTIGLGEKYEYSYRYKLEGYDTAWQQAAPDVSCINYSSLPPGDYTFYAKTVNEDGFESSQPYIMSISISKPFWQRWWFYLLVGITGALMVSLVFFWRIRALKHKSKLRQLIRSSQLTALKAQMNPHFVFNALNSIQDFVLRNDIKNANRYLGRFSELMRKVLDASGKESIPLQQEIDILALYLDLEKLRFGAQFTYSLDTDQEIDAAEIYIPAMIIQPFIENAIKHGLLHKEGPKQLSVHFRQQHNEDAHIICSIEDNGIGRKRAIEIKQRSADIRSNGFAIKATEKRLDLLNSYYKEKIGVKIIDLFENGIASGTLVELLIPCYREPVDEPG